METPLVTIAVPTVARPQMLEQTLESVLAQTYGSVQVLVSDNGADPGTRRVVSAIDDPRLQYRKNPSTVPAVVHFNQCLDVAGGKYFVILSDDDLISPNFVEALAELMERHADAVVALSRTETMCEAGRTQTTLPVPDWEERPGIEFVLDWLWGRAPAVAATFLSAFWRTETLRRVGGFPAFADGSNSENGTLVAAACMGSVVFGREAVFRYRVYPESCGLRVPPERLALSATQFKRHVEEDPAMQSALATLPAEQRTAVVHGVRRMLAGQYLGRLATLYLPRIGLRGVLSAIKHYDTDPEFNRALLRFYVTLARQVALRCLPGR